MTHQDINITEHAEFSRHLLEAIVSTRRGESSLALLIVSVDGINRVNTTLGYEAGRRLIAQAAERISSVLRENDTLHRVGEREFAITLPGIFNEGHATLAATKIFGLLSEEPFMVAENSVRLRSFTGIALCPEHAVDEENLLQKADLMLQCCRDLQQNHMVYSPETAAQLSDRWRLENELDDAISSGALELFFQPKVRVRDGRVCGAEALVRWRNKTRGLIPPDLFIQMADRTGRIKPLTWFVVKAGLRQLSEWPDYEDPLSVSVNLTPNIIEDSEIIEVVRDATEIWNIEADRLTLEVTELALMTDPYSSFKILAQLKELGFRISIDDFGTGYSSLAYFKHIPAHELKIDKSFVLRMLHDNSDRIIVQTIIDLAHNFNMQVVAEGVEDGETTEMLKKMGCDYLQGHYFSRPLPQESFLAWLERYVSADAGILR